MTTIALLALGYVALVVFVLSLLTAAKRGDEAMGRVDEAVRLGEHSVEILPDHASLGRVAVEVSALFAAERVSVVLADPDDRDGGVVAACLGAPGLLGSRVPVEAAPATGTLGSAEAGALGLTDADGDAPWAFAHVPLACPGGRLGAVTVASRRLLAFSSGELHLIERLARSGAPEFERRRVARTPRTAA